MSEISESKHASDFHIIGGGLMGLLTAYELSGLGYRVTVFDRQEMGKESSWAGGGILSPLYPWKYPKPINQLSLWSQRVYPRLARRLYEESEIDPEYQLSGLLVLDADQFEQARSWAHQSGARYAEMGHYWLEYSEPAIRLGLDAIQFPHIGQIRNPALLRALIQVLWQRGVKLVPHHPLNEVISEKGRVCAIRVGEEKVRVENLILTTGAWTASLVDVPGFESGIRPVRGQMLLFKAGAGLIKHILLKDGRYVIPRRDGHILVGSTMEEVGFDKSTTDSALKEIFQFACDLVPALENTPLAQRWAGLRPASPQGIPLIGPHPTIRGVWLNAGHFRNGVAMAPASVRLLLDQIFQRNSILSLPPYLPSNKT
ncbi:MAG: glycine oxidase ThiO [Gammaproteobacteria bacterium]|nr:glycine oxidase ThiO [Gammaproteobacteria bacterium]MDH5693607.1 glycine oxidase ThiO [Gammaproteobacteria bacterium]